MVNLIKRALELFSKNTPFIIATIVKKEGSSPREEGASMLVTKDGLDFGTIGGGAEEYNAIEYAKELIKKEKSENKKFILTNNQAESIGMVCGGVNVVHFEYVSPEDNLAEKYFNKIIDNYSTVELELVYSLSEDIGFSILVDGELQSFTRGEPKLKIELFKLKIVNELRVFIFGGGHVSKALVPILNYLNLKTIVVEDRAEFLREEDFPNSKKVLADYSNLMNLNIEREDYVCILTRGHKSDGLVLRQVLEKSPTYVGVIGSRKKAQLMLDSLKGTEYEDLLEGRVYSPVGLEIGAQTPEEISISIAAQIVEKYRGEK
ncbi:xanthine dehydrogenase accessory factor [Anaerosphaera aminiphila DSM 21120]|uniref:Xanthine dehydrogenase accessory factor n=1 Tax=Anaerosphaera aminiphila DSM 21120 TaxID=1120995 RepID=A0A1M5UEJ2_9FIRM|nr:XdhC/CoxI family protein [Anaerosphaera aminiphila]SHH61465.1 xanthine dehydrogenase accessory factor [Anaerosphaera aminiphila DSM 21120]